MRAVDIIAKKRDGQALSVEEIRWFIEAYTRGDVADYQVAAWLMAVCIRGMNDAELTALTLAMAESGDMLDLSPVADYVVDKHSSGGVGDKTTLVVLPLVAACDVPVAKMSGRGLGYSGGTLDKMEAIAGFRVDLTEDEFYAQAQQIGIVLTGQSRDLAPADGQLYALRDVTGTVPSIPLIASSIMSKKLASGAHGIVLDVKVGSGAFMTTLDDAKRLAKDMVSIGTLSGRQVIALISDMNQPLGYAVGNALEVVEAIQTMRGSGPADFREHCLEVAAHMLRLAGRGERWLTLDENHHHLAEQLENGGALAKFRQMVEAQGGDTRMVDEPQLLPQARIIETMTATQSGYIAKVDAIQVAQAAFELGAGREKKGDTLDLAVGVVVHVKVGDAVTAGDPLVTIYANDPAKALQSKTYLDAAFAYNAGSVDRLPLFYDVIGAD